MKETLVVSAFPACGKSYTYEKYGNRKVILDSDSSEFSWIETRERRPGGKVIRERNPDFPNNYINHIKENIGKTDIIFVSSHLNVRQALTDAGIKYVTVYPKRNCRLAWVGRMYLRGNDLEFISFINDNWDKFMNDIHSEPHGDNLLRLGADMYLDEILAPWLS